MRSRLYLLLPLVLACDMYAQKAAPDFTRELVGQKFYSCRDPQGLQRVDGTPFGHDDVLATIPLTVEAVQAEWQPDMSRYLLHLTMRGSEGPELKGVAVVVAEDASAGQLQSIVAASLNMTTTPANGGNPEIQRGMYGYDVICMLGRPDSENTYNDERQLIYNGGARIIDLDAQGVVTSVTNFGK